MTDSYEERREHLTRLLLAIPLMENDEGRDSVLREMKRRQYSLSVSPAPNDRVHCLSIVDAAMARPGALQCLTRVLCFLDASDPAFSFMRYVAQWYSNDFLSPRERDELVGELSVFVAPSRLIRYYRIATKEISRQPLAHLDELVREIEQLSWPEPGHPLIRLTEAIAHDARSEHARQIARKWSGLLAERIDGRAGGPGCEREILDKLRSSESDLAAVTLSQPTLMFQLNPSIPRPDHYRFTAWLVLGSKREKIFESDGHEFTLAKVRAMVGNVLDRALEIADQGDQSPIDINLEFILPRDLLCAPIEDWTNREPSYMSLGVQFVVVVRDLVRQGDRQRGIAWGRKWARILQDAEGADGAMPIWITCAESSCEPGQMYRNLLADDCVSLGLTFRPDDTVHGFELAEALDAGVPIVIWPRRCEHSDGHRSVRDVGASEDFKRKLCERLAGHRLTDLPRIVYEMRKSDSGFAMTLLWDNYALRPELDNYSLDVPGPLGRTV